MFSWTPFIPSFRSPNPPQESGSAPVSWPKFTEQDQEYLLLDLKPRVERRYKAKKMAFWNEIVSGVLKLATKKATKTVKGIPKDEL